MNWPETKSRAFTLIELLVVIAIIAIIAALLVPTLSAAKTPIEDARCISNLRQCRIALNLYLRYYNDRVSWKGTNPALNGIKTGRPLNYSLAEATVACQMHQGRSVIIRLTICSSGPATSTCGFLHTATTVSNLIW